MAPSGHIYKVLTCTSVKNRGFDSRTGIKKKYIRVEMRTC